MIFGTNRTSRTKFATSGHSKIAMQQLSGDLNISTVFSGALEQLTTCGARAANQVYRKSKVFDSYIDSKKCLA
jgi:hypothetical protein